jgi:hypothetical protein
MVLMKDNLQKWRHERKAEGRGHELKAELEDWCLHCFLGKLINEFGVHGVSKK